MCEDKIPLSKIQEGESAVVRELTSTGSMRRRLLASRRNNKIARKGMIS